MFFSCTDCWSMQMESIHKHLSDFFRSRRRALSQFFVILRVRPCHLMGRSEAWPSHVYDRASYDWAESSGTKAGAGKGGRGGAEVGVGS